jgi:hypothetical protein
MVGEISGVDQVKDGIHGIYIWFKVDVGDDAVFFDGATEVVNHHADVLADDEACLREPKL